MEQLEEYVWNGPNGIEFIARKMHVPGLRSWWNGYVRFPEKPVQNDDLIEMWVHVHGGVTWNNTNDDGTHEYGFDCAHWRSNEDPACQDVDGVRLECVKMGAYIIALIDYEREIAPTLGQAEAKLVAAIEQIESNDFTLASLDWKEKPKNEDHR